MPRKKYEFKDPRRSPALAPLGFGELTTLAHTAGVNRDYRLRKDVEQEVQWRLMLAWSAGVAEADRRAEEQAKEFLSL